MSLDREPTLLLGRYYAVGHSSLPNYIAQVSGQGPNPATEGDCPVYGVFASSGTASPGQEQGSGCVYPESVQTVAAAGGLIGTLVLSPLASAGTTSDPLYNHYSLLASIEDAFGLPYLGYAAAPGLNRFGSDVFSPLTSRNTSSAAATCA